MLRTFSSCARAPPASAAVIASAASIANFLPAIIPPPLSSKTIQGRDDRALWPAWQGRRGGRVARRQPSISNSVVALPPVLLPPSAACAVYSDASAVAWAVSALVSAARWAVTLV